MVSIELMRKVVITLLLFVALIPVGGGKVEALTMSARDRQSTPSGITKREAIEERIEAKRAEIQERFEARKEALATRAAERRLRLAERRQELIRKFFGRMLKRFEAAIARMERIASRIESRLDKMEERGIDVAGLRSDLAVVGEDIVVARGLLEGLDEKVEAALEADDPKLAFEEVRDTVQETREMLKGIHQKLVAIIVAMKGPQTGVSVATESATPTATESAGTD